MAKKKLARIIIQMMSEAGTGFHYTTTKNVKNTPEKLMLCKYDPVVKQHVLFSEQKIKRSK
ncbi:ribosomal protein L33-domain-containing protein [Pavlovales sp. CCMP2436]|nr:ribosomal protein L33-domain-containing protein [Pavlovales sp. CCMP2436]